MPRQQNFSCLLDNLSAQNSNRFEKFYRPGGYSNAFFEIGDLALAPLKPPGSVDIDPNSVPTNWTILQSGKYLAKAFLDLFPSELVSTVSSDPADGSARRYVS